MENGNSVYYSLLSSSAPPFGNGSVVNSQQNGSANGVWSNYSTETTQQSRVISASKYNVNSQNGSANGVWPNYSTETTQQSRVISAPIDIDAQHLLELVKDIVEPNSRAESKERSIKSGTDKFNPGLSQLIHRITCVISNDCQDKDVPVHERVKALSFLSNYSVDAQIILVIAAFAIRYGDFLIIVNQHEKDRSLFMESFVNLKKITGTFEGENSQDSQIVLIKDIIIALLHIVKIINELKDFHLWNNIQSEISIEENVYYMIKTVIHCSITVSYLCNGYTVGFNEKLELELSTQTITLYHKKLNTSIITYREKEEQTRELAEYQKLLSYLQFRQTSNIETLNYFISSVKEENILCNSQTNKFTSFKVLHNKTVLILYSSSTTETLEDELSCLGKFYNNTYISSKYGYEIVWVPIDDQKNSIEEERYNEIISKIKMPYYTLAYKAFLKVNRGLVRMLRKDWGFTGKPMLVVLDERGQVVRQNALLMLHLYGAKAFPFTTKHEEELLIKSFGGMQFLHEQRIDANVSEWLKKSENKLVCLYGGGTIEWCESMVNKLKAVTEQTTIEVKSLAKTSIMVKTVYVGRNTNHREAVEKKLNALTEKNLGYYLDYSKSGSFWKHVQKYVMHLSTHDAREVFEEKLSWAYSLLAFDNSEDSWVAIGNDDCLLVFRGSIFLRGLEAISENKETWAKWQSEVTTVGSFFEVLGERVGKKRIKEEGHCHKFEIVDNPALIKQGMYYCPTCEEPMELVTMLRCCKPATATATKTETATATATAHAPATKTATATAT